MKTTSPRERASAKFASAHFSLRRSALVLPLLLGGCAGGCEGPPAEPADPTARLRAGAIAAADALDPPKGLTRTSADEAEQTLDVALPQRREDDTFPGLGTLPRRRLGAFEPSRHFIAKLRRDGLIIFDRAVPDGDLEDEARIEAALRVAAEDYTVRSGVAANRVVLVVDREADRRVATRLRAAAHWAGTWRVVALARDDGKLVEVMLDPPPAQRPSISPR